MYINKYATQSALQSDVKNDVLLKPYVAYIEDQQVVDFDSYSKPDWSKEPLTFEVIESGTFNFRNYVNDSVSEYEYKLNDGEWVSTTSKFSQTLSVGDVFQVRANNSGRTTSLEMQYSTCKVDVKGNIMSLYSKDNYENLTTLQYNNQFASIFYGLKIVNAKELVLPATTLSNQCYRTMFSGMSLLISAPTLPATTLASGCYAGMFEGCTSLTTAPTLPTTTVPSYGYSGMFSGCSNLENVKCLATSFQSNSFNNWLSGVSETGTFVKKSGVTWSTGASGIPTGWTVVEE